MASDSQGLDALFQNTDSEAWQDLMNQAKASEAIGQTVAPELYAAVFGSPAGMQILEDMYNRYVNITRCVPGQGTDAAFYREGMAQVVFDIVANITQATEGTEDGTQG